MGLANEEKSRDIERELVNTAYLPTSYPSDEKRPKQPSRMPSIRRFLCTLLVLSVLTFGLVSATSNGRLPRNPTPSDKLRFQELLSSVEPSSLHEVLHEHMEKYKHGVFKEDKAALAAVHQADAVKATSLIELAKRQGAGNTNSSSASVAVSTTTALAITEVTSTLVNSITSSTVISETSTPSSSSPPTTSQSTPTSQSTSVSTSQSTSTRVETKTSSSVIVTSSSTTVAPSTTNPASTSESGSQSQSSSPSSSPSPTSQSSVSSLELITTKMPNGSPTTITRTTVVPAGQADQTAVGGASSSTSGASASLQTNTGSTKRAGASYFIGAIGLLVFRAL